MVTIQPVEMVGPIRPHTKAIIDNLADSMRGRSNNVFELVNGDRIRNAHEWNGHSYALISAAQLDALDGIDTRLNGMDDRLQLVVVRLLHRVCHDPVAPGF